MSKRQPPSRPAKATPAKASLRNGHPENAQPERQVREPLAPVRPSLRRRLLLLLAVFALVAWIAFLTIMALAT